MDAGAFGVTAGVLRFDPGPSFEDPTDDGADNVYNVSLRAEEGARRSDLFPVAVSVVNADDGVLTLSPDPPVVGRTLRATLVDLDGGATNFRWQWTKSPASPGPRYSLVAASYTPEASDAGQTLTVTVTYDDRCAFDNTLSVTSQPVESPPADTPDLVVGAPSVTDSRPATGASFTLSATVRNQGSGSAVGHDAALLPFHGWDDFHQRYAGRHGPGERPGGVGHQRRVHPSDGSVGPRARTTTGPASSRWPEKPIPATTAPVR